VAGDSEEVDIFEGAAGAEIERQLAGDLHGVGVEESAGGVGDGGERCDGLDDAGLVIGEHDGDEFGVGANGGDEIGRFDEALGSGGEEGDVDVAALERFGCVKDGVVLEAGGDNVVLLFGGGELGGDGAEDGEIVALGASGGEDDLGGAAVQEARDGVAGVVDGGAGDLALLVDRAGVAVMLHPKREHGLEDFRKDRRGGVRVHINAGALSGIGDHTVADVSRILEELFNYQILRRFWRRQICFLSRYSQVAATMMMRSSGDKSL